MMTQGHAAKRATHTQTVLRSVALPRPGIGGQPRNAYPSSARCRFPRYFPPRQHERAYPFAARVAETESPASQDSDAYPDSPRWRGSASRRPSILRIPTPGSPPGPQRSRQPSSRRIPTVPALAGTQFRKGSSR